jgi:hypothetical protein
MTKKKMRVGKQRGIIVETAIAKKTYRVEATYKCGLCVDSMVIADSDEEAVRLAITNQREAHFAPRFITHVDVSEIERSSN